MWKIYIFVSDDTSAMPIDYADLRKLKQTGTFRQAIIFNMEMLNDNSMDELMTAIKTLQYPTDK